MYLHGKTWFDPVSLKIHIGDKPLLTSSEIPPVPEPGISAIQAVVTRKCNLNCTYCNVRLSGDTNRTMDKATVDEVIRTAGEAPDGRLLMVTGGEPLLVLEITFEILSRIEPPSVLFTNATLIHGRTAEIIRGTGVSPVVSLDGAAESHDGNRCGSWQKAADGLDALAGAGVAYGISAVVTRRNLHAIPRDMEAINDRFHPTGMGFNILHWTERGFDPVSGEEYASAMEDVFRTALKHGIFVDQIARRIGPIVTGRYRHRDCSAMGGKVVFHPDGRTSNCISSRTVSDWSRRIPAFMDECGKCHAAGICGGGCAWDGIHLGAKGGPDPRHCLWTMRILDLFLEDVEMNFPPGPVTVKMLRDRYLPLVSRGGSPLGTSIGHGEK